MIYIIIYNATYYILCIISYTNDIKTHHNTICKYVSIVTSD